MGNAKWDKLVLKLLDYQSIEYLRFFYSCFSYKKSERPSLNRTCLTPFFIFAP